MFFAMQLYYVAINLCRVSFQEKNVMIKQYKFLDMTLLPFGSSRGDVTGINPPIIIHGQRVHTLRVVTIKYLMV